MGRRAERVPRTPGSLPARFRLEGRRTLLTGAAGGIGEAIAHTFREAGSALALVDVDGARLRSLLRSLTASPGPPVSSIRADVTRERDVARAVREAAAKLGGIDIVVNAAGITSKGDVTSTDPAAWRRLLDINVTGTFLTCHEAVPYLRRARGGAIVTISSVYSLIGGRDRAAYSTSKGALDALTRSMAADLAKDGIRVNAVNPGFIHSPMTEGSLQDPKAMRFFRSATPLRRLGDPQDVADAILYFAAPASRFVTGVCMALDGGRALGR